MSDTPGIYAKMSSAAKSVGYGIDKDGKNDFHRYQYTSAANVRKECGIAMGKHGIAVSSRIMVLCSEQRTDAKGKPSNHVEVISTLTFYDADDGSSICVQGFGCGTDNGDKAPMKAQTAAEKYAYLSAFTIAMGEDPEADESTDRQATDGAPRRAHEDWPQEDQEARDLAVHACQSWALEHKEALEEAITCAAADMTEADDDDTKRRTVQQQQSALIIRWIREHGPSLNAVCNAHPVGQQFRVKVHTKLRAWCREVDVSEALVNDTFRSLHDTGDTGDAS